LEDGSLASVVSGTNEALGYQMLVCWAFED
jgi:hypothetical protein